eukprot:UN27590
MMIIVEFAGKKNLTKMKITANMKPQAGDCSALREIRLYTNKSEFDFDDVENYNARYEIKLSENQVAKPCIIDLEKTKFRNTESVVIYIHDNQDDTDHTFVNQIKFSASDSMVTNMSELKKADEVKRWEAG